MKAVSLAADGVVAWFVVGASFPDLLVLVVDGAAPGCGIALARW
ncbi:hypothetical protein [Candidatus Binatus sp.]